MTSLKRDYGLTAWNPAPLLDGLGHGPLDESRGPWLGRRRPEKRRTSV